MRPLLAVLLIPPLAGCDTISARAPQMFESTDGIMQLVYAGLLLVLVLGGTSVFAQGGILKTIRNMAAIALAFLVLIVGYTYKDDLGGVYNRIKAEIIPGSPQSGADGEVILRRTRGGHFETTALVNGTLMNFLVDTGASSVVLPYDEALRIGFTEDDLSFTMQVSTANGSAFVAPVTINALKVGDIVVNDIRAAVSQAGDLNEGLLGMTFLNRLESYSFAGPLLTLRE